MPAPTGTNLMRCSGSTRSVDGGDQQHTLMQDAIMPQMMDSAALGLGGAGCRLARFQVVPWQVIRAGYLDVWPFLLDVTRIWIVEHLRWG